MFNHLTNAISTKLTDLLRKAVVKFDISLYILPKDVGVEITIVDTSTIYSPDAYNLAVQA